MNILQIQNMPMQLCEIGRIKLGMKGVMKKSQAGNDYQPPKKLDHFIVTTNERGEDDNFVIDKPIMAKLGEKPREIPIYLLFDDIELNLQTRYVMYSGKKCICKGDGVNWYHLDPKDNTFKQGAEPTKQLAIGYKGSDKCKSTAILSVVLSNAEIVGGVWKFRTTGFLTVQALTSSLKLISYMTGGYLAGIPLTLVTTPAQTTDAEGKTIKYMVTTVVFKGAPALLRERGLQMLSAGESYHRKLREIESRAKVDLIHKPYEFESDEHADEIAEEFFPDGIIEEIRKEKEGSIIEKLGAVANGATEPAIQSAVYSDIPNESTPKGDAPPVATETNTEVSKPSETESTPAKTEDTTSGEEVKKVKKPRKTPEKPAPVTSEVESTGDISNEPKVHPKDDSDIEFPPKALEGVVEERSEKTKLPPKEHLKVLLIEAGIDSEDLRHTFYKNYPMTPEQYLADINLLKVNVDTFKKKLILTLQRNLPSMIEQIADAGKKQTAQKSYGQLNKDNFADIMSFYADIKGGK
jgi:hypothetical protein